MADDRNSADWVIVPREPTEEMLNAGWLLQRHARRNYAAMLAAAPPPPQGEQKPARGEVSSEAPDLRPSVECLAEIRRMEEVNAVAAHNARDLLVGAPAPSPTVALREALERRLLREARQYVECAGDDEDPETSRLSNALLLEIDAALSAAPAGGVGSSGE